MDAGLHRCVGHLGVVRLRLGWQGEGRRLRPTASSDDPPGGSMGTGRARLGAGEGGDRRSHTRPSDPERGRASSCRSKRSEHEREGAEQATRGHRGVGRCIRIRSMQILHVFEGARLPVREARAHEASAHSSSTASPRSATRRHPAPRGVGTDRVVMPRSAALPWPGIAIDDCGHHPTGGAVARASTRLPGARLGRGRRTIAVRREASAERHTPRRRLHSAAHPPSRSTSPCSGSPSFSWPSPP